MLQRHEGQLEVKGMDWESQKREAQEYSRNIAEIQGCSPPMRGIPEILACGILFVA